MQDLSQQQSAFKPSPKLYTDDLAERLKELAGESYRPSNGEEGCYFAEAWCEHCKRDAPYQKKDGFEGCKIIVYAMAFNISDPQYPKEWIYGEDGQPKCTAFELNVPERHNPSSTPRCTETLDLFGGDQ